MKLGCVPRKSLILKFPNIRKKYYYHFIRGYFDGDGTTCIFKRRLFISILGTLKFTNKIKLLFQTCTKIIKQGNIFKFQISKYSECKRIYKLLYKNSKICLLRKKKIMDKFFTKIKPIG